MSAGGGGVDRCCRSPAARSTLARLMLRVNVQHRRHVSAQRLIVRGSPRPPPASIFETPSLISMCALDTQAFFLHNTP